MLLKVSLIIAILASIGTLVLSHLQVADKVQGLKDNLQSTQTELTGAKKDADTAKKDFKKAKEEAEKTSKELAETQSNLETTTSNWKTQQERGDRFEKSFKKASDELTEATHDLAAWKALNIPVDQVKNRLVELDQTRTANDALTEEKKVMVRTISDQKRRLDYYEGTGKELVVIMDPMKGEVLAIDPTWEFVVVNLGSNDGAKERGELLISRKGKLLGKARITRVEPNRSIANLLPEWKVPEEEVKVHDLVVN